ncbi:MAG: ABC transporter ATP-binding protein, partial [Spirochaetales bacterium]|nr:ABC transporter ATP-binding protein [Spirochaetales bacterium]
MILSVKDVNSFYANSHILFDLNLEIDEGQVVCILGRNGVGKSTTMKSIAGQMNARNKAKVTGSMMFDGKELVGIAPHKVAHIGIGYVPQGRHVFPNLTVRENLQIAERKPEGGEQVWTIDKIYDLFPQLKSRETSWGNNLSGGEQQMLAVARGLMQNPKLLLLDEITEGLAPVIVNELKDIIKKLRDEYKVTILLAEQNAKFALSVSEYCYIMEKGSIVHSDKTSEITKEIREQY